MPPSPRETPAPTHNCRICHNIRVLRSPSVEVGDEVFGPRALVVFADVAGRTLSQAEGVDVGLRTPVNTMAI